MTVLVEMDLTSPLNLCTSNLNLVLGGTTYYGLKGLGRINPAQTTPSEIKQINFEISGVPSELVSLALSEPVQGKAVRLKLAIFDPATYTVLDTVLFWAGELDVMSLVDAANGSTISVTAEHVGIDLNRPASSFYTDDEQQALHAGDLFLQYTSQQVEQQIVWPAAAYFRK
jgi:hypothetical protein